MTPLTTYEAVVLLTLGVLSLGAILTEVLMWGPAQGCAIVFAGAGFGCR